MDDLDGERDPSIEMDVNNNVERPNQQTDDNVFGNTSRLRFAVNGNVRYILQMFHPPFAHTFMQNALHNVSILPLFLSDSLPSGDYQ